jgi:hypothetical protein
MLLSLQLENQKQKLVILPLQMESQKQRSRATYPITGEPKAEISCYFPFSWRTGSRNIVLLSLELGTRSRNLVLLFLHLESQKKKLRAAFSSAGEREAETSSCFPFS